MIKILDKYSKKNKDIVIVKMDYKIYSKLIDDSFDIINWKDITPDLKILEEESKKTKAYSSVDELFIDLSK